MPVPVQIAEYRVQFKYCGLEHGTRTKHKQVE